MPYRRDGSLRAQSHNCAAILRSSAAPSPWGFCALSFSRSFSLPEDARFPQGRSSTRAIILQKEKEMSSFSQARIGLAIFLALTVLACCGPIQAAVIYTPGSSSDELAFDSQISATDLINIGQPSFASSANTVPPVSQLPFTIDGANDGLTASYVTDQAGAIAHNTWYLYEDPDTTLTYALNTDPGTGGSATGYDITGVNVFTGWQDAFYFTNQKWTMRVATLANPTFTDVYAVDFLSPSDAKASMISLTDSTGTIASGVTSVQFYVEKKETEALNLGIVFRDIDVLGAATVPEPGTIAMLGIAALLGLAAIRRRRA
jgi:hypothetical protein